MGNLRDPAHAVRWFCFSLNNWQRSPSGEFTTDSTGRLRAEKLVFFRERVSRENLSEIQSQYGRDDYFMPNWISLDRNCEDTFVPMMPSQQRQFDDILGQDHAKSWLERLMSYVCSWVGWRESST